MTYLHQINRCGISLRAVAFWGLLLATASEIKALEWEVEIVADAGVNIGLSLAYAPSGDKGIAYGDIDTRTLQFLEWSADTETWAMESVDTSSNVGLYPSLVYDASGQPAIAYFDDQEDDLKFARREQGAWVIESVDTAGTAGRYPSLALNSEGLALIAYSRGSEGLYLARETQGGWQTEQVGNYGTVGTHNSLAIMPNGQPAIATYHSGRDALWFYAFDGLEWTGVEVDYDASGAGDYGRYASLAIGNDGQPAIAYHDDGTSVPKYATFDGQDWHTETIDAEAAGGEDTSLTFNSAGVPVVAYRVNTLGSPDMGVATLVDSSWEVELIETSGTTGIFASAASNSAGSEVSIAWFRDTGDTIRMATYVFPESFTTTIDESSKYAYAANAGWISLRNDAVEASVIVYDGYLTGYAYAANFGWIHFGDGPVNGYAYANDSGDDYGVNLTAGGRLEGYAYSPSTGWINFEQEFGLPQIELRTGEFSGYAWSGNLGWINLGVSLLQTLSIAVVDSDEDGLSDSWELSRLGALDIADSTTDTDGDGMTDREEELADTHPLDPKSFLVANLQNDPKTGSLLLVVDGASASRLFGVEYSPTLPGQWEDFGFGMLSASEVSLLEIDTEALDEQQNFFRIIARPPLRD